MFVMICGGVLASFFLGVVVGAMLDFGGKNNRDE